MHPPKIASPWAGLTCGVVAFVLAETLIPRDFRNPTEHDIHLANRLGFIYSSLVAWWVAWTQRSRRLAVHGTIVSLLVGGLYWWLTLSQNFLLIMTGFPCLLGGIMAAALPSEFSSPIRGAFLRMVKGLVAGAVLGFTYMFVLNMLPMTLGGVPWDGNGYARLMWQTGPIALGVGSALFLPLFRWAIGLTSISVVNHDDLSAKRPPN